MRLQVLKRQYQDLPELQPYLDNIQQDVQRGTQVLENLLLLARRGQLKHPNCRWKALICG